MFMRSGLIRKDLLPKYAPAPFHPATTTVTTVAALLSFFSPPPPPSSKFVVKYSDSSNAYGLRFVDCATPASLEAGLDAVAADMERDSSPRVIQAYVPPLLIPADPESPSPTLHKFHLRLLVLVRGDMDVYM
jgi:hypothetical protein